MQEPTIICPKCKTEIKLTETLAGPLLEATKKQAAEDLAAANKRAETIAASVGEAVAREHNATKAAAITEARADAYQAIEDAKATARLAELRASALSGKLQEAQQVQAAAVKREGELADKERELNLTIEREIAARTFTIRDHAIKESDEANRLKLLERDQLVEVMQKKVAELQQKIEQGSTQIQGEVQEEDLKTRLRMAFPRDTIEDVGKGITGADLTQTLDGGAGVILWESKRTKSFSQGWLPKLREDGRAARADVLVLASQALPADVDGFGCQDSVWMCAPRYAVPLAAVLRETLLSVARERRAVEGQETRAVTVYRYVTGAQFRRRVESLVEAFSSMKDDLDAERRALAKAWAKRETQLERALLGAAGLVGDVQALGAPGDVPEIEGLNMKALGGGE